MVSYRKNPLLYKHKTTYKMRYNLINKQLPKLCNIHIVVLMYGELSGNIN